MTRDVSLLWRPLQITLAACFILMFGNSMLLTSFYASSLVSIWVSCSSLGSLVQSNPVPTSLTSSVRSSPVQSDESGLVQFINLNPSECSEPGLLH